MEKGSMREANPMTKAGIKKPGNLFASEKEEVTYRPTSGLHGVG